MPALNLDDLISGALSAKPRHRDVQVTLDSGVAEQVEALELRIVELEREEMETFAAADRELQDAKADARLGDTRQEEITKARDERTADIRARIAELEAQRDALTEGTLITIRFTVLPGHAWAEIAAHHPGRPDVAIDSVYGYNYHETATAAARFREPAGVGQEARAYSHLVVPAEGEEEEPTLVEISPQQWDGILKVISGHEFERIADAVWVLNDYGPQQRIAAAGKASRAGSAARSS